VSRSVCQWDHMAACSGDCKPCAPKEPRHVCCDCVHWVRLGRRSADPGACPVLGMNTMERGGGCDEHYRQRG